MEKSSEGIIAHMGGAYGLVMLLGLMLIIGFSTYVLMVNLRRIAFGRQLFDRTDKRTVHSGHIPRLGGLIFLPVLAFFVTLITVLSLTDVAHQVAWLHSWSLSAYWLCVLMGSIVLLAIGFKDDMVGMNYKPKFLGQVIATMLLLLLGDYFYFGDLFYLDRLATSLGLSVSLYRGLSFLLVLTIINAFNLIDGIDGLCSGLALIAFSSYAVWFAWFGSISNAVVCLVMVAVLLAFLRINLFASVEKQTKMFMGDTGSMTLGFMLAAIALEFSASASGHRGAPSLPIVLALSPLMVPLLDLVWVFFGRLVRGRSPFLADKTHIHHRIMDTGLSKAQALYILLLLSLGITLLNALLRSWDATLLVGLDVLLWIAFNVTLYKVRKI